MEENKQCARETNIIKQKKSFLRNVQGGFYSKEHKGGFCRRWRLGLPPGGQGKEAVKSTPSEFEGPGWGTGTGVVALGLNARSQLAAGWGYGEQRRRPAARGRAARLYCGVLVGVTAKRLNKGHMFGRLRDLV